MNSQIICDLNVVRFVSWASDRDNLTIEGWNGGDGYSCEYDKYDKHEIKTFREYFEFHDLEPVMGTHTLFSEVFKSLDENSVLSNISRVSPLV